MSKACTSASFAIQEEEAVAFLIQDVAHKLHHTAPDFLVFTCSSKKDFAKVALLLYQAYPSSICIGVTSPYQMTQDQSMQEGIALFAMHSHSLSLQPILCTNLSKGILYSLEKGIKTISHPPQNSLALWIEGGESTRGEEVMRAISQILGPQGVAFGGIVAADQGVEGARIAYQGDIYEDSALLVSIQSPLFASLGVSHGYVSISDALPITHAEKTQLVEIAGRPAFSVWKEIVCAKEPHFSMQDLQNLEIRKDLFLRYSPAIQGTQHNRIRYIRDCLPDGSLEFFSTIPHQKTFEVMYTNTSLQHQSVAQAVQQALENVEGRVICGWVFDCGCRPKLLGQDFHTQKNILREQIPDIPWMVFVSFGEIAMDLRVTPEIHNISTVVVLFWEHETLK